MPPLHTRPQLTNPIPPEVTGINGINVPALSTMPPLAGTILHPPTIVHMNHERDWHLRGLLWLIALLLFLIWGAEHGWTQAQINPAGLYQWTGTKWVPVNATNPLPITGSVTAANPCASNTGSTVPAQGCYLALNLSGNLVGATAVNPFGSAYAQQMDLSSMNGVTLGSPSNYGTSPGAVAVQGVNAFITNTPSVTPTDTSGNQQFIDPCQRGAKTFINLNQTANTRVLVGVSAKHWYICSILIPEQTAAQNIALVEGTGTVCATNTIAVPGITGGSGTAATGANLTINQGFAFGSGGFSVGETSVAADDVCLLQSGSSQLSGGITAVDF